LHSPASRRNGRAFERGRGILRGRVARVSALYPTSGMGRAHDP
jgi:hypothetical protein